uniref:DUF4573 domain-containing protein n=1 Tax=Plantactinospora soyae TaxID=1544732 RepID=UPI00384F1E62
MLRRSTTRSVPVRRPSAARRAPPPADREAGPPGSAREGGLPRPVREVGPLGAVREVGPLGAVREVGPLGAVREVGPLGAVREASGQPFRPLEKPRMTYRWRTRKTARIGSAASTRPAATRP